MKNREIELPGNVLTVIDSKSLIWIWQGKSMLLNELDNKRLRFIKHMVSIQAKRHNIFWNGVHYIGYVKAINNILKERSNTIKPTNPIGDAKIIEKSIKKSAQMKADRFLDRLNVTFPKSKFVKSINNQLEITNQINKSNTV